MAYRASAASSSQQSILLYWMINMGGGEELMPPRGLIKASHLFRFSDDADLLSCKCYIRRRGKVNQTPSVEACFGSQFWPAINPPPANSSSGDIHH
ncbi:hypothetical protein ZWY2020_029328 [Hordeum vulgare]|nr:hypothetical protein ZWY2020_029328 [Hordeum vulgare]